MRAAAIDRFGGPRAVSLHRLPVPDPGPGEVLIAMDTAGIGEWDATRSDGSTPPERVSFPMILGVDGAGTVARVGSHVRRFRPGDVVYAYAYENAKGGFFAEYVAVAADQVALKPSRLGVREAGAMPVTGLTALQGVDDALGLEAGENILIHGASGGVGSLAVQFAKRRGARILATASGRDGVALLRRLGADVAVDGKRANLAKAVKALAPEGLDAVLAFAGGPALTRGLGLLRRGGRLAHPNGVNPAPRKRRGLKLTVYDAETGRRAWERLERAVQESRLEVPIMRTYPLAQAARALERVARGHVLGKVVLRIR